MSIVARPLPFASTAEAEVATRLRDPGEASTLAPGSSIAEPRSLNLARPWKFPSGHADSIRCRRHSRSSVQVPVQIALCRQDGSPYDKGTGVIRDLSYSGLRLGDVFLVQGRLLAPYFAIELRHALESPVGGTIAGRILRTDSSELPGFGIEFLFPGSGAEARLRRRI